MHFSLIYAVYSPILEAVNRYIVFYHENLLANLQSSLGFSGESLSKIYQAIKLVKLRILSDNLILSYFLLSFL